MKNRPLIKLGLPKGRMQAGVVSLLDQAGVRVVAGSRAYRPMLSLPRFETKILKPQNIVEMLNIGSRDIGFTGVDWVAELDAQVVELLDTELDPVRIVAAVPTGLCLKQGFPGRELVVASEYEQLTKRWIEKKGFKARFIHSLGATEVFPPEDADCIVDNMATGSTLSANNLEVYDELMSSSTVLYASVQAMEEREKRARIEDFVLLLKSVLEARKRVMLELNVGAEQLEMVVEILPCMREPTISRLHGDSGYAVKVAVPREDLPQLIPAIKSRGGADIVVTNLTQIVP